MFARGDDARGGRGGAARGARALCASTSRRYCRSSPESLASAPGTRRGHTGASARSALLAFRGRSRRARWGPTTLARVLLEMHPRPNRRQSESAPPARDASFAVCSAATSCIAVSIRSTSPRRMARTNSRQRCWSCGWGSLPSARVRKSWVASVWFWRRAESKGVVPSSAVSHGLPRVEEDRRQGRFRRVCDTIGVLAMSRRPPIRRPRREAKACGRRPDRSLGISSTSRR